MRLTAVTLLARGSGVGVEGGEASILGLSARAEWGLAALVREEDTIGDVDHAVGALDSGHDLGVGVGTSHEAVAGVDGDEDTSLLGGSVSVQAESIVSAAVSGGALGVGGDVVLEDVGELGDVLEQGINGASRELLEGLIGGSEEGKLVRTSKSAVKLGGSEGSSEGVVVSSALHCVSNALSGFGVLGGRRHDNHLEGG